MTSFKLLVDFARSHLKLSQMNLSDLWGVDVTDIKNWIRRGFPERSTKESFGVKEICETLFFDPAYEILKVYGSSEKIINDFISYVQGHEYSFDNAENFTQNDFLLSMNDFLLADVQKKKQISPKVDPCSNIYDYLLGVIKNISSVSLPDYSTLTNTDTKCCTVSRATLISLANHCLNIDIDNELSEGCTVDALNQHIQDNPCDFLKEFAKQGYKFEEKNGSVIVVASQNIDQAEIDENTLYEILKTLHEAYKSYDIHSRVSDCKKIELNCSISVFANALAFRGVFNTIERKKYFCEFVSDMIRTHNHDCNYLYPILSSTKGKEKRPPLVDVGIEKVVALVGDYCNDVYLTDNNALGFIGNFLKTLDYYKIDRAHKVGVLEQLIYDRKTYDLRLVEAIAEIDKSRLVTLQKHLEANIFSLTNSSITENTRRELIAFICMFGRATFDGLIYFEAPTSEIFLKAYSKLINFVIKKIDNIVPNDHIRRKDVAHSLSCIMLTMRKYDEDLAKETLNNINIEKFENHKLFKDTYAFIIHNEISVLCASEYTKSFSTRKEFLNYIETHLICSENPFISEENPLLLLALNYIRSAANEEDWYELSSDLKNFADSLLFWMIEATEEDARQNRSLRYLYLLVKQYPGCINWNRNKEYAMKKAQLLGAIVHSQKFSLLDPRLLQNIWDHFNRDTKQEITTELNECTEYVFEIGKELDAIDFLLSNYYFVNESNKEKISVFIRKLINRQADLTKLSSVNIRKIVNFIAKNQIKDTTRTERTQLLCSLPHLERLSIYDKFDVVCWKLLDKASSEEIAKSITNGEIVYREFLDFLLGSKFRSWQRASLKNLLSSLIQPHSFWSLDLNLQINLIHFVKDKGEYYDELKCLMKDISEKELFADLDSKLKTALTLHCHHYIELDDPQNILYFEFLEEILSTLTQNAYTHAEIKNVYGLRTDTLIYHILDVYKAHPEKTAIICISSICKIYKQLLRLSLEDEWNPFKSRLLTDRVKLFNTVIANPYIKHIAKHYAREMYKLINGAEMDSMDSHLKTLRKTLVRICKNDQWPNWFDIHPIDIRVLKDDTIETGICIETKSFLIDANADSNSPNEKARDDLSNWRNNMDDSPLTPSKGNEVVALCYKNSYLPISGWGLVYECIKSEEDEDEYSPSEIIATIVSIADIEPIQFNFLAEEWDYEKIIYLYNKIFKDIMDLVPFKSKKKSWIKKGQEYHERIFIRENYNAIDKSIYTKLVAFLDFYYEHIYVMPNIRPYALDPYYDYYKSVEKEILDRLMNKQN